MVALLPLLLAATTVNSATDARLLRYPDVSRTHITFVYAGDIWIVPKTGGAAHRLSSPPVEETMPRFSPDGSRIAFTAQSDGNPGVSILPSAVERVTFHPSSDTASDWMPDGSSLQVASGLQSETGKSRQFFRVPASGGMPVRLPVPYGEIGAVSPDGAWLAYTPRTIHARTWKRYRVGTVPDLCRFNLQTYESRNLTDHPAADEFPMWHGRKLCFLADRDSTERHNLWVHNLDDGSFRQVTRFTDTDVHTPSIGPEDIVFHAGARLHLLDLATESHRSLDIDVVTDLATLRARTETVGSQVRRVVPSPEGRRVGSSSPSPPATEPS